MSVDMFTTRFMLSVLEQMYKPKTFLLDTFFPKEERSNSEYVDIDVVKGKRRLAPFVSPLLEGKPVERLGYTTNSFKPPYVKPYMVCEAANFLKRLPGNTIYGPNDTPAARAQKMLAADLAELDQQITRREEWMAAQILTTGKCQCDGEGISLLIDFGLDVTHTPTLSGGAEWDDLTNSDPLKSLRDWRRLIAKDSGVVPDVVIFGTECYDKFVLNAKVTSAFDNRRIDRGMIDPKDLPSGAQYLGYLKDCHCDAYLYDEWYLDTSGVLQPMVPVKKVIMGSTKARAARHYGAIVDVENGLGAVPRFPKSWITKNPSAQFVMVQSAPVPAYHQIDALLCAKAVSG
jgi:hypothetical protein